MKTTTKLEKLQRIATIHANAINIVSQVQFQGKDCALVKDVLDDMLERAAKLKAKIDALAPPAAARAPDLVLAPKTVDAIADAVGPLADVPKELAGAIPGKPA